MARRGWHSHRRHRRRRRRRRRLASARALVLVDISNSYVISWVLLGAPESCYYLPTYHSYRPRTRIRETRGEDWGRTSLLPRSVLRHVLFRRACVTLSFHENSSAFPPNRGLSFREGCTGVDFGDNDILCLRLTLRSSGLRSSCFP